MIRGSITIRDGTQEFHFVGPLNLNSTEKKASTVMGTEIPLTDKEYDALERLATHESEPVSFEELFAIIRQPGTSKEAARMNLNHLVKQINESGEGFMWLDYKPNTGYTFHTRWGHNWKAKPPPPAYAFLKEAPLAEPKVWRKKTAKTLFSGAAVLAASVALFLMLVLGGSPAEQEYFELDDLPVPLHATPALPPCDCEYEEPDTECDCAT